MAHQQKPLHVGADAHLSVERRPADVMVWHEGELKQPWMYTVSDAAGRVLGVHMGCGLHVATYGDIAAAVERPAGTGAAASPRGGGRRHRRGTRPVKRHLAGSLHRVGKRHGVDSAERQSGDLP